MKTKYKFLVFEEFEGYNIDKNQNQIFDPSFDDLRNEILLSDVEE